MTDLPLRDAVSKIVRHAYAAGWSAASDDDAKEIGRDQSAGVFLEVWLPEFLAALDAAEQRGAARGVQWQPIENEQIDIPLEVRRELMKAATANGRISYNWLCAVYRRGRMELADVVEAMRVAAPEFCSLKCPSHFPTTASPRHVPACDGIRAALSKADGCAPSPPESASSSQEGA